MYLELSAHEASRASFPDCLISSFMADDDQVSFCSDGIFVDDVGFVGPNAKVSCVIFGPVQVREYTDGEWSILEPSSLTGLREICEWSADGCDLIFAGFENGSGLWAEYGVSKFSMKITISA